MVSVSRVGYKEERRAGAASGQHHRTVPEASPAHHGAQDTAIRGEYLPRVRCRNGIGFVEGNEGRYTALCRQPWTSSPPSNCRHYAYKGASGDRHCLSPLARQGVLPTVG